jgi:hypothetical protein
VIELRPAIAVRWGPQGEVGVDNSGINGRRGRLTVRRKRSGSGSHFPMTTTALRPLGWIGGRGEREGACVVCSERRKRGGRGRKWQRGWWIFFNPDMVGAVASGVVERGGR